MRANRLRGLSALTRMLIATGVMLGMAGCGPSFEATTAAEATTRTTSEWPEYGGGTGQRFVIAEEINRDNVTDLEVA